MDIKGEALGKQLDGLALSLQPAGVCGSQNTHVASTEPKAWGTQGRAAWTSCAFAFVVSSLTALVHCSQDPAARCLVSPSY